MAEAMFGIERVKQSLGAVAWAAWNTHLVGSGEARLVRKAEETRVVRKRAVARIASIVHQIEKDLLFLNEVRNGLRQLPEIGDEYTIVIAGYPNVGKSSFIRQVSGADPEIAPYPFTTKGIIVGHRQVGRKRVQFVDTPGLLDRPQEERNRIERQALGALLHAASVILFILDPSETCGYPIEKQLHLLEELKTLVTAPIIVVQNKADLCTIPGYAAMSTATGEGVQDVLGRLLTGMGPMPRPR
jgi:nucleolar GTP-binding protein